MTDSNPNPAELPSQPKIGDVATCTNCGWQISFRGADWMHDSEIPQLNKQHRCLTVAEPELPSQVEPEPWKMTNAEWDDVYEAVRYEVGPGRTGANAGVWRVDVRRSVEAAVRLRIVVPAATISEQAAEIARLRTWGARVERELANADKGWIAAADARASAEAKIAAVEAVCKKAETDAFLRQGSGNLIHAKDLRAALAATSKEPRVPPQS